MKFDAFAKIFFDRQFAVSEAVSEAGHAFAAMKIVRVADRCGKV
jgi:hypothetical protein